MAKCKLCRKTVRWIQVADGDFLKWIAVDPRSKPTTKHQCKEVERIKALPGARIEDPWWTK